MSIVVIFSKEILHKFKIKLKIWQEIKAFFKLENVLNVFYYLKQLTFNVVV